MGLPKTNGRIDTESVAEQIFYHLAVKIHGYHGIETRESNEFRDEMIQYVKEILDETTNQ